MQKFIDNPRLVFKCCQFYYGDGLTQLEIANKLGISRPSVSRMLSLGRERGYVRIQMFPPDYAAAEFTDLEHRLENELGLSEAMILPALDLSSFYRSAGQLLFETLFRVVSPEGVVGVSTGRTLKALLKCDYHAPLPLRCTFVPLVGGVGEVNQSTHANHLAEKYAERLSAEYVPFFAPAILSSRETAKELLKERIYQGVLDLYKRMQILVVSVGATNKGLSLLAQNNYCERSSLNRAISNGAIGDISMQVFNTRGETAPFAEFNGRVMGFSLESYSRVPSRICVTVGEEKAPALFAAIRGGYINTVIVDPSCANRLLDLHSLQSD